MLNLESVAAHAFAGVSFSPERRAQQAVAGYESECAADIALMRKVAEIDPSEQIARYVAGYRRHASAILASSSRCVSSMIAGPSNFPAARMNKRGAIHHRRIEDMAEWRRRALKAALRDLRPSIAPIKSSDADAVERYESQLASLERSQAIMVAANAAIRKHAKAGAAHQVAALIELGMSEAQAIECLKPDFCGRVGFASYSLSNNNANIRRVKDRIEQISKMQAAPVVESVAPSGSGVRLEDDPPANRVRLFFPGKPDEAIRSKLKASGFRWAPSVGAWQAFRNYRAMEVAKGFAA